jgi:hypothetical protein
VTIKDSAEGWVRSKPVLAMVAVAVIGLLIGGIVGLGAGYKIEKNRVQDDVRRIQEQLKAAGATTVNPKVVQRVGDVEAVSGTTLTVKTRFQGDQDVLTTSTTPFEATAEGDVGDIAVDKRILVATGGHEVIVLNDGAEIGGKVTKVSDDGFTVAFNTGRSSTVKTSNVDKVYTLTAGQSSDAVVGTRVVVAGRQGTNGFSAIEVIVLPPDSAFSS